MFVLICQNIEKRLTRHFFRFAAYVQSEYLNLSKKFPFVAKNAVD